MGLDFRSYVTLCNNVTTNWRVANQKCSDTNQLLTTFHAEVVENAEKIPGGNYLSAQRFAPLWP
jgi:hypothetical protein